VDELTVHVAPLLLGEGLRLWDGLGGLGGPRVALTLVDTVHSPHVSHLVYRLGAAAA
jgi:hypothetical protein